MSSSNTSTAEVDVIKNITNIFVQVWSYLLICSGILGHSLSIYVFTRPKFRSNSCVRYFLASAVSGVFVTFINVSLRLIQTVYYIDAFAYSTASCKILTYLSYVARLQTSWFITLACIDRLLYSSQSVAKRAWSHPRVASRVIPLTMLVAGLAYIYVPIQYELKQARWRCPSNQGSNTFFNSLWTLIIFGVGPSIVMLIFGSLTIRHVQLSVKRIAPQNADTQNQVGPLPRLGQLQRQKATDRQLTQMMIVQISSFILLSSPSSMNGLYNSLRPSVILDAVQSAKNDLLLNVLGFLSLTSACTSFYFFTLSSELFRRELIQLFKGRWQSIRKDTTNAIALA